MFSSTCRSRQRAREVLVAKVALSREVKGMRSSMRLGCALIALMFCSVAGCGPEYSCPQEQFIDCMPIVSPDRVDICSGQYHEFIKTHCPALQFTYQVAPGWGSVGDERVTARS